MHNLSKCATTFGEVKRSCRPASDRSPSSCRLFSKFINQCFRSLAADSERRSMFNSAGFLHWAVSRAGLNESEAPSKVVTARPPKRLAQLRSVSHALVSTLQKYRSKTSEVKQFGSLHFRDHWGWPCTEVRMWRICSNRKFYHKNESSNVHFKLR